MLISDVLSCHTNNELYFNKLIDDIKQNHVVPFIGAGMSADYYPNWKDTLKNAIEGQGKSHENHVLELLEKNQYEQAASYVQNILGNMAFLDYLQKVFSCEKLENQTIPTTIKILNTIFNKTIITTNLDHMLKWAFEILNNPFIEIVTPRSEMDQPAIDRIWRAHTLIKLHGSISREEDIILTKEQYDRIYGENSLSNTPFVQLLKAVFTNNVLLFLGCSLVKDRTIQVLENIIQYDHRSQYHYAIMEMPAETNNLDNPFNPILFLNEEKLKSWKKLKNTCQICTYV